MTILLLIVGMLCLVKGADWFVDGSSSVARMLKVPSVIIGLTIVALGTSLPEASVSITAGLVGNNELAISNVVGSDIFNTLVVVGASALITPFIMDKDIVRRDLKINLFVSFLLAVFVSINGYLDRWEGLILLVLLVMYIGTLIRSAMQNRTQEENAKTLSAPMSIVYIVVGIAAIILGGNLVVDNATKIAQLLGLSDTLIGLTIVSIGTSLPELMTSIVAARKGESGLSLGNAIGSNILNIIFILGVSSVLSPIAALTENIMDAWILVVVACFTLWIAKKDDQMTRAKGALFVVIYVVYLIYIIFR
ncbi:calcium/sodium antiporter [Absicoccus intestinalis]|uniref:Calcium/sodium antiporter n=1 Tax=Absicoccus intestinalis TaxID=2926319 RepID=A0ABU4WLG4_9FIRM|nr:calcium/sodium antiporter [Absicoccus sp. CLA-KB-P134]MDX8416249.1 calcium/sodium antiporter [Absicoccus sp. CLA-KB-P134]